MIARRPGSLSCRVFGDARADTVSFVAGHGTPVWLYRPFFAALAALDVQVHAFEIPAETYTTAVDATRARFHEYADRLVEANEHRPIIGLSLGADLAFRAASMDSSIRSIAALCTGASFARSAWNTPSMRRAFERRSVSFDELDDEWATLSPEHNLPTVRGDVHVTFSTRDRIVGARNGAALATGVVRHRATNTVRTLSTPTHGGACLMAMACALRNIEGSGRGP